MVHIPAASYCESTIRPEVWINILQPSMSLKHAFSLSVARLCAAGTTLEDHARGGLALVTTLWIHAVRHFICGHAARPPPTTHKGRQETGV